MLILPDRDSDRGISKPLLRVLAGEALDPPPVWLMRQAGRYLPEYREVRARAGSFLDLCYSPELATEVTLQPIRRFGFDAAILFSDILVIPHALGQNVRFEEGRGPLLDPIGTTMVDALDERRALDRLAPVLETVGRVSGALDDETALIGFCGAPWTVATYMIAGKGTPDQTPARLAALRDPEGFQALIDKLVRVSAEYLVAQVRAGAEVVQIFDTWAGVLDAEQFGRWAVAPVARLIALVRKRSPGVKVIAFAKGIGAKLGVYAQQTGADAVGVDWATPLEAVRGMVDGGTVLQGNLDPLRLVAGGTALEEGIDRVLKGAASHPHIFNLGHGIVPETPPEHVAALVARIRSGEPCSG